MCNQTYVCYLSHLKNAQPKTEWKKPFIQKCIAIRKFKSNRFAQIFVISLCTNIFAQNPLSTLQKSLKF